ncbi:unnamed protein product [Didymodactylos carnosus]|uniref:Uncharacterized protein n=1 Tax=Didymodactylos carnosus TaxID=1234261 RepID=A0A813NCX4_9BILA|nr:unnamed protein product [Didymodactylos carnosus]CAF0738068.1 unnamed protein product [Didymodactylos carnosus]CAF0796218.1 unnamed protein product [Didymodactylos carnosus]CAF3516106.1 unnamed protein product [Didymodactylos carnosus]CAF3516124.1 unnamed protein product [Didymodactylos carnosus]
MTPMREFSSSRTSGPRTTSTEGETTGKLSETITECGANKTCETFFEGDFGESKEMRLSIEDEGLRTTAVQTELGGRPRRHAAAEVVSSNFGSSEYNA